MFDGIVHFWWNLLYGLTKMLAWLLGLLYDLFEKAVGLDTVVYNKKDVTILNLIFTNSVVNRAYWSMAIIGIGLCFFFTIIGVIRKGFDSSEEMKGSLGQMMTRSLKSVIIICSMSLIMALALNFTSALMRGVQIAFFSNTQEATESDPKTYTKEEYATMARVMNTIGNYSLNPSYDSRYNINSCYNAIRSDLAKLKAAGTFGVQYETPDVTYQKEHYWQEALQKIVVAAPSLDQDITLDIYNETLSTAMKNVMDELRTDKQFLPLEKYISSVKVTDSTQIELDRVILLVGTLDASYDSEYNGANASIKDVLRAPFYYNNAGHDLYDQDDMWNSFDMSEYHYVFTIFLIGVMLFNMIGITMTTIARVFNMAVLYVVSPPIIAISPMDNGAKFKQWRTSFIIQCFNVFGTLVAIDLVVTFIPIIMSNDLIVFQNPLGNYMAKLVLIWGGLSAAKKAANLVNGILGENAGMTSAESLRMDEAAAPMSAALGGAMGWASGAKLLGMTYGNFKSRVQEHMPFNGRKKDKGDKDKGDKGGADGGSGGGAGGSDKAGGGGDDEDESLDNNLQNLNDQDGEKDGGKGIGGKGIGGFSGKLPSRVAEKRRNSFSGFDYMRPSGGSKAGGTKGKGTGTQNLNGDTKSKDSKSTGNTQVNTQNQKGTGNQKKSTNSTNPPSKYSTSHAAPEKDKN